MERIEITREQAIAQSEIDRNTMVNLKESNFIKSEDLGFYEERIKQLENILDKGSGVFSIFRNEQAEIIIK